MRGSPPSSQVVTMSQSVRKGLPSRSPEVVPDPAAGDGEGQLERLERLRQEFEANAAKAPAGKSPFVAVTQQASKFWSTHSRVSKAIIGLLLLAVVGWLPIRSLLQATSTEAVVNARLVTLRAPIEGDIESPTGINVGTHFKAGDTVLRVVNRRAERSRLDDLTRLIDQIESERAGIGSRIADMAVIQAELTGQLRSFQEGRLNQLKARAAEIASEMAAARANRDAAQQALARVQPMANSGSIPAATLERYKRDAQVTAETYTAIEHRLSAMQVELKAAEAGTFIGDTYNDQPRSAQRIDEIAQRLNELNADLRDRDTRIATLRKELTQEEKRHGERAEAVLTTPVAATVWEVLTSPGETVVRGQDLVRLLDCSGTVVTAGVSESVYNRLHIGQSASFVLRGESDAHAGQIVGLTGVASAPANLAIQPSALSKEPYRVTVRLLDSDPTEGCKVGRTGRVTFGK
jgi:multidrug resistance efflux pump